MKEINNYITKSIDNNFCNVLEYYLSRIFRNSPDKIFKYFWCDGVVIPDEIQLNKDNIAKTNIIVTRAWAGRSGQDNYGIIIKLGPHSLNACLEDLNLSDYLPGEDSMSWVKVNIKECKIELQLN